MTSALTQVSAGFEKGFDDQANEISVPDLDVVGTLPEWLSGTLIRNGPARFRLAEKTVNHWFDGLAMVHRFDIANGVVGYSNRYLDTPAYRANEAGEMRYSEFATDPCRSLFQRVTQMFAVPEFGANTNISIGKIADQFVAQTEVPMPVAFDKETLATIGVVGYDDQLKGYVTTAHPHYDPQQLAAYNYLLNFGASSTYAVYRLSDGGTTREVLGSPTARKPSYMHSFALSAKYAILMEFPLVVNPLRMLASGKPFIANYRWEPERGTRFSLIDRGTGDVSHAHIDEAWFGFHHVNAVDRDDGSGLVDLDIVVYPTAEVVQHYYLTSLLDRPNHNVYPASQLRRFTIDTNDATVTSRTLIDHAAELPRINYPRYNAKPYRYVYANGIAATGASVFLDTIVKFDIDSGDVTEWRHDNHFPGEPVFVGRPQAMDEDDGVLLTVVLDADNDTSYLLVLDAADLTETARVTVPQHIPFGFHGAYIGHAPTAGTEGAR